MFHEKFETIRWPIKLHVSSHCNLELLEVCFGPETVVRTRSQHSNSYKSAISRRRRRRSSRPTFTCSDVHVQSLKIAGIIFRQRYFYCSSSATLTSSFLYHCNDLCTFFYINNVALSALITLLMSA